MNVAFLEQVQPRDLEASDIEVRLGATWVKPEYIRDFMGELFQTPKYFLGDEIDVRYSKSTGEWNISGKSRDSYGNVRVRMTYGTDRVNGYKLLEDALKNCERKRTHLICTTRQMRSLFITFYFSQ